MVNRPALCAHCKALCSRYVNNDDLQRWIGSLNVLEDSTFLKQMKEISSLFALSLQGRIDEIKPGFFETLSVINNTKGSTVTDVHGNTVKPDYLPKEPVFRQLLSQDGASPEIQKLWAGMMKLKTAVVPRTTRKPSQSKLKEHSLSITKPFDGDPTVFKEIEQKVRTLTQMLVKHADLETDDIERYYLPITHHPAKDKAFTAISSDGLTAKRGKRFEYTPFNLKGVLKLQEIQEIYFMDPDTFISRVFTGHKIENGSFDITVNGTVEKGTTPLTIIGFIPKPGDKERVVAIPSAIMQSLSYPIGKIVKEINSNWNIQGVDSHANCCDDISIRIRNYNGSRTFYSLDMSNFTDRFPYDGLISVFVDELVNLGILKPVDKCIMDTVCHGKILLDNQVRSYGVGTPMGTFPSFPCASCNNGIVGAIAYADAHLHGDVSKIQLDKLPMKVIGDDIVIWDDSTYQYYKSYMNRLGVEVQDSKCMQSTYVAEMCSKIITDQGVFQQKRIDSLYESDSVQALVDMYNYYGDDILEYVDPEVIPYLDSLKRIPEPLGLAPYLDDPYWDSHPVSKLIYSALEKGRQYKKTESVSLDAKDFDLIYTRASLIPKDLKYEIPEEESRDPFKRSALIESLEQEIILNMSLITDHKTSLEDKVECANRVQELCRVLQTLTPPGYFDQKKLEADYHIYDSHRTTRRNDKDTEIDNSLKEMIRLDESIHTPVKEDDDYGIE